MKVYVANYNFPVLISAIQPGFVLNTSVHTILLCFNCNKCTCQVFDLGHIFMNQAAFMISTFNFICCLQQSNFFLTAVF